MVRNFFVVTIITIIMLVLQASVFRSTFPSIIFPDLVLLLIIALGLRVPTVPGLLLAWWVGICTDMLTGVRLGYFATAAVSSFLVVGSSGGHIRSGHTRHSADGTRYIADQSWIYLVLLTTLAGLAKAISCILLSVVILPPTFMEEMSLDFFSLVKLGLIETAGSALLAPFVVKKLATWIQSSKRLY